MQYRMAENVIITKTSLPLIPYPTMTTPMVGDTEMTIFDAQKRMPPIITIGRFPKRSARIPAKGPEKHRKNGIVDIQNALFIAMNLVV